MALPNPEELNPDPGSRIADRASGSLPDWQIQTIEIFVRTADLLGLPKSIGQVYGLLFCTEEPLPLDAIKDRLQISKGSTSQALNTLKRLRAIKPVLILGERRDYYEPELQLRRLVSGFLNEQVIPHLDSGKVRIHAIKTQKEEDIPPKLQERLDRLNAWRSQSIKLIPIITKFLGK